MLLTDQFHPSVLGTTQFGGIIGHRFRFAETRRLEPTRIDAAGNQISIDRLGPFLGKGLVLTPVVESLILTNGTTHEPPQQWRREVVDKIALLR